MPYVEQYYSKSRKVMGYFRMTIRLWALSSEANDIEEHARPCWVKT